MTAGKIAVMTSEQSDATFTVEMPAEAHRLRRRTSDRVIGGVAAGVADYLNVDPLLLRAVFAGLMIFGGAGLVLYVLAWLLIPAQDREDSIVESLLVGIGLRFGNAGMAILVFLAVVIAGAWLSGWGSSEPFGPVALLGVAIVALGILYLHWSETLGRAGSHLQTAVAAAESRAEPDAGTGPLPEVPVALARLRERSPLGWYGLATALIAAGVIAGAWMSGYGHGQRFLAIVLAGLATIALGMLLLRRSQMPGRAGSHVPAASAAADSLMEPGARSRAVPEARPANARPRERSPLGWYVLAAALVAAGMLAIVGTVPGLRVAPGQYFGVVVAVIGLGLVVGAWWGRARLLIILGLLLLPVAVAAAFVTVPLEGGIGELEFRPQALGELRGEYRLAGGNLRLDLTDLSAAGTSVTVTASVGVGRLVVVVPDGVQVELDAHVAGGELVLFGNRQIGTGLGDRVERLSGPSGPSGRLILNLEVGIGDVVVDAAGAGGG
jgi:phage shock protein PspC (stress-responsive transcriptional regulator)